MSDRKGRIKPIGSIDVYSLQELRELKAAALQRTDTLDKAIDKATKDHMPVGVVAIEREALGLWHGLDDFPGLSARLEEQLNVFDPRYQEPQTREQRELDWENQGGAKRGEKQPVPGAQVLAEALSKALGQEVPTEWVKKWSKADRLAAWEWLQSADDRATTSADEAEAEMPFIIRGLLEHAAPRPALAAGESEVVADPTELEGYMVALRERLLAQHRDVPVTWLSRLPDESLSEIELFTEALERGELPAEPACFGELQVIRTDRRKRMTVYAEAVLEEPAHAGVS